MRGKHVFAVGIELLEPSRLVLACEAGPSLLDERQIEIELPLPSLFALACLGQSLIRILANGFQKTIASAFAGNHHKRLVDEVAEQVENVLAGDAPARRDRLRGLERPTAREDGKPAKKDPFLLG